MSSLESSGGLRSLLDRVLVSVLAASVMALGAAGYAYIPSLFGTKTPTCSQFSERFDKIDALPDGNKKKKRLDGLLATKEYENCPGFREAVDERDSSTGRSVAVTKQPPSASIPIPESTPGPAVLPHDQSSANASPSPAPIPPITWNVPVGEPSAEAPPPPPQPRIAEREPAKPLPDIVVGPPPFSDPSVPFDGGIGDELVMKRGARYELRPIQRNTLTYNVVAGNLIVEVGGTPYFYCKPGDTFRLYWKNKPEFVAVSMDDRSDLKITDVEAGKHLGTSTCHDTPG